MSRGRTPFGHRLVPRVGVAGDDRQQAAVTEHDVRLDPAARARQRLDDDYTGMNRLHSLAEWLENERPVGTVMILDCDFAFRAAVVKRAAPGRPIGQIWYDFSWSSNCSICYATRSTF